MKRNRAIRAVSLFSGAGGMDLGFQKAGFDIVWANDFNKAACETHAANFDCEIKQGAIEGFDYAKDIPDCALVFGGPPCQGFSVAGKMDPNDPRSRLVFEFQKVVTAKRPRYFVMENVSALARLEKFEDVRKRLLDGYSRLGYNVEFRVLDSQYFLTPQRRERMIMIGTTDDLTSFPFPRPHKKLISARSILAGFDAPGTGNNLGRCDARITLAKRPVLRTSAYAGMLFNGLGRPIDLDRPCQTLPASMGGNKTPFIDTHWLRNPSGDNWLKKIHAIAMSGKSICNLSVPSYFRRITVSEAAALQGFPKSFKFCGSRCDQYKQIGNSVPPPFAHCIAAEVMKRFVAQQK